MTVLYQLSYLAPVLAASLFCQYLVLHLKFKTDIGNCQRQISVLCESSIGYRSNKKRVKNPNTVFPVLKITSDFGTTRSKLIVLLISSKNFQWEASTMTNDQVSYVQVCEHLLSIFQPFYNHVHTPRKLRKPSQVRCIVIGKQCLQQDCLHHIICCVLTFV